MRVWYPLVLYLKDFCIHQQGSLPTRTSIMADSKVSHTYDRALELMKNTPLIDGHNDFAYMIRGWFQNNVGHDSFNIESLPIGQTDIGRLKRGRLGGQFWSAFVPCPSVDDDKHVALRPTLQQIDLLLTVFDRYSDVFGFVDKSEDIIPVFRSGRIVSLMGIEGLHQIGGSFSALRLMHKLGVRYATLCHNKGNEFADSATSDPVHGGLSRLGREAVLELNRIGMMIDLSHTSHETQLDVLAISKAPVIFSHSSCYDLCPNPRNVRSEVLSLLKRNNGIIMICFLPSLAIDNSMVNGGSDKRRASVASVANHIIHVGNTIGYSHVGIGSDFDGMLEGPAGLDDTACYPQLIAELLRRGIAESDVELIMGLNIVRVMSEVEAVSAAAARWTGMMRCDDIPPPWTEEQKALLVEKGKERDLTT